MATTKKTAEKETVKATKTAAKAKTEAKAETKTAAKTTKAAKVKETEVNTVIQFQGKDVSVADIVNEVKKEYANSGDKNPLEKIDIYVQPENGKAYVVVNGISWNEPVEF